MKSAPAPQGFGLDRRLIRRSFERASERYDEFAVLQAEVRSLLLARLEFASLAPRLVLDAGAGTGHASKALKQRYPGARVIAVDFALGMLHQAAARRSWRRGFERVCADACALPFANASVDLILSNFLLHWCDGPALLGEFRRVLAPRGLLMLTSLGPDTLAELRGAWRSIDAQSHVHRFADMHDLGDELVRRGFAAPVLDVERYTLQYKSVAALFADLRGAGARNAATGRPKGLTGKRKFSSLAENYESLRAAGRLPATFEVIYAQAWTPPAGAGQESGGAAITLAELRAKLPHRKRE